MFLIRPKPFPLESLSSWRQRAGMANGFRKYPRPDGRNWAVDPDRRPDPYELEWLTTEFRASSNDVSALSLDSQIAHFTNAECKTKLRWVTPCGSRSLLTQSGPVCCPTCLREDPIPYFRLAWRFAFLSHCPKHGTPMIDRCPFCESLLW